MGIDLGLLRELCAHTLDHTDLPALGRKSEGKVRDSYVRGDRRTLIVTDRVSCFDVVVGTLPLKGQVLNQVAAFWFERTRQIAPNHLLSVPDPCVSVVRECRPLPVEFVYRGYLTGSTSTSTRQPGAGRSGLWTSRVSNRPPTVTLRRSPSSMAGLSRKSSSPPKRTNGDRSRSERWLASRRATLPASLASTVSPSRAIRRGRGTRSPGRRRAGWRSPGGRSSSPA